VDQSPETKKLLGDKFLNFGPVFSKLVYFGPHMSAFLKSTREGLQTLKILWAIVEKQESYWVIKFWTLVPIFSKLVNFGPDLLAFVEKPWNFLRAIKILWTKVQKQQSYASKTEKFIIVGNFGGP